VDSPAEVVAFLEAAVDAADSGRAVAAPAAAASLPAAARARRA
jgi:hypothetical protein